jgi:O-antigen/teichoic acid export membrane protein
LSVDDRRTLTSAATAAMPYPIDNLPSRSGAASWRGKARSTLVARLYRDAGAIALASLVAAALGVFFWAVAARAITPERLGVQTALLAAILAPASIIAPGIGDALNAVAPRAPEYRDMLIRHGYRLVAIVAVPTGMLAGAVAMIALPATRGSLSAGLTVLLGVVIWSLFTVQDSALTTLGRTRWLAVESALAGIVKLALLPLLMALAFSVVWATLIPAAIAVVILVPVIQRLSRSGATTERRRTPRALAARKSLTRLAVRTTCSVALTLGAVTFLPFVVTSVAGPAQGALFTLALSSVSVLDFVTAGVGVSLVVHSSSNRQHEALLVRAALTRTLPIVGVAALCLIALSAEILKLLNPSYLHLHGAEVITILALTSVLRAVYLIWASLQQARGVMGPVLRLNTVAAVGVYLAVIVSGHRFGALGAAVALAVAQLLLSGGAIVHLRRNAPARPPDHPESSEQIDDSQIGAL